MKITKIIPQKNYHITIQLENQQDIDIDCRPFLTKGIGRELKDFEMFQKAKLDQFGGIYWPNGFDICPDIVENPDLMNHMN